MCNLTDFGSVFSPPPPHNKSKIVTGIPAFDLLREETGEEQAHDVASEYQKMVERMNSQLQIDRLKQDLAAKDIIRSPNASAAFRRYQSEPSVSGSVSPRASWLEVGCGGG